MEEELKDRVLDWLSKELKGSFQNICDHDIEMQTISKDVDGAFCELRSLLPEDENVRKALLRYADSRDALEFARARHGVVFGIALVMLLLSELKYA